ncbi:hypothetical protein ACFSTC_01195 [Nonomuraea ferruginea]
MSRTQGPALRGAAYLGAVLVSAALLLVALVALAPTEDDRFAQLGRRHGGGRPLAGRGRGAR